MPDDAVPSWEEVARLHGRTIYNFAYRLTGNAHDAHDLVQEVLLRVRRGLPGYAPHGAVGVCDVVGLSYEEIADAAAIPVGTVRSRIHRGRRMLRGLLE